MNAVQKALDEVCRSIPRQILDAVFIGNLRGYNPRLGLHEAIMTQVIRSRVLVDCNLVGGIKESINLDGLPRTNLDDYTTVIHIPKDRTQGRTITTPLAVTYQDMTRIGLYGMNGTTHNSTFLRAGQAVMDAHAAIPMMSTARVSLISENTIMIRDSISLPAYSRLDAMLANDDEMSHLPMRAYFAFKKLVILAVQAHIYNEYIVTMDMGEIHAGQQLGTFKNIIEGYSSANEDYETYVTTTWSKVALMSDDRQYNEFLRAKIGSFR